MSGSLLGAQSDAEDPAGVHLWDKNKTQKEMKLLQHLTTLNAGQQKAETRHTMILCYAIWFSPTRSAGPAEVMRRLPGQDMTSTKKLQ